MEAESARKPGSVVDSHSSRRSVAATLEQPTRRHRGPRHGLPIWSCSRWGLPCRSVAGLAVRSYRTISPLPVPASAFGGAEALGRTSSDKCSAAAGTSAVSFCCTFRRLAPPRRYLAPCPVEPGLSSALLRVTRLSGRLRRRHCLTARAPGSKECSLFGKARFRSASIRQSAERGRQPACAAQGRNDGPRRPFPANQRKSAEQSQPRIDRALYRAGPYRPIQGRQQ